MNTPTYSAQTPATKTRRRSAGRGASVLVGMLAGVVVSSFLLSAQVATPAVQNTAGGSELAEARRLYEQQEFDRALPLLETLVGRLEAEAPTNPAVVPVLIAALELRALARAAARLDWKGAAEDFKSLLLRDPRHTLPATLSPRILKRFEEVKKVTIGSVVITVTPPDAQVEIDGQPMIIGEESIPLAVGTHALTASRLGYATLSQSFQVVAASESQPVTGVLQRSSAILAMITSPSGVEVLVDEVLKGVTPPGPTPPNYADRLDEFKLTPANSSGVFVLGDITPGTHVIEFRKVCYVSVTNRVVVKEPKDYRMDPLLMAPAVAALRVDGDTPGLSVYLDDEPRGVTPIALESVCQGPHTLEVRGGYGRGVRRLDLRTGDNVAVKVNVRPAFALMTATGLQPGLRGGPDLRNKTEQTVGDAGSIILFAPPADIVLQLLQKLQLESGWLDFDRSHRSIGDVSARVTSDARIELSTQIATSLGVQGVATITSVPNGEPGQVFISLLASGSGEPDVLGLDVNDPASRRDLVAQLRDVPTLFQPSVGILTIDVLDREGAVVARVDPYTSVAAAGITVGDVILSADRQPVANGTVFASIVAAHRAGQTLTIEYRNPGGDTRTAALQVTATPRLVAMTDRTVLFNKLLVDFRAMLARPLTPLEESVARLNAGVALIALGNHAEAKRELERVKLPPGRGVSAATTQYLLGLCAEKAGQVSEAERLWKAAAQGPDSLLTEGGPTIKELAELKLKELLPTQRR